MLELVEMLSQEQVLPATIRRVKKERLSLFHVPICDDAHDRADGLPCHWRNPTVTSMELRVRAVLPRGEGETVLVLDRLKSVWTERVAITQTEHRGLQTSGVCLK